MTSNKLLGIIAALSLTTLLWEMFSSLEGPNSAAHKREGDPAEEPAMTPSPSGQRAEAWAHKAEWRGWPCFCEPGLYVRDRSHQQFQRNDDENSEKAAVQ